MKYNELISISSKNKKEDILFYKKNLFLEDLEKLFLKDLEIFFFENLSFKNWFIDEKVQILNFWGSTKLRLPKWRDDILKLRRNRQDSI